MKKLVILVICIGCIVCVNKNSDLKEENKLEGNILLAKIKNETNFVFENEKLLLPCIGVITSGFGYRESNNEIVSKNHKGIDIGAAKGTDIVAAHDGIVLKSGVFGNYGKCVILKNTKYITLYAHCSKVLVEEGKIIKKGEKIAEVGRTRKCYR